MKKSLRIKLFIGVSGLIAFYVLLSLFLNARFLQAYYLSNKENMLAESSESISKVYNGEPADISLELEKLERNTGINIMILDNGLKIRYDSTVRKFDRPGLGNGSGRRQVQENEQGKILEAREIVRKGFLSKPSGKKYNIQVTRDPRLNTNFLNLSTVLGNGDILLLSAPLTAIRESADIANRFFLLTGIITFIVGSIGVFIFSRKFTRPILELNEIAGSMSKLDFSKKLDVRTDDEVGELGKSINSLSDQLDRSISELKQANEKLKEDIEQERKIDEMRKEFISNVSHELKTPIALIQGYAEGLRLNVNQDEENKNFYCEVIGDEAGKMGRLVRELLDLSQMESGQFRLERSVFNVSTLVGRLMDKYLPIFKEKGLTPQLEITEDIHVDADSIRVEQVLVNYINNAINHVDNRGIIKVGLEKQGKKARVLVYNSGKPIPENSLERIWTSFYKVDKARTRAYGGTGLGLSIVRAIQELHQNGYGACNISDGVEFWFDMDVA